MTPEEHERLARVETLQEEIQKDQTEFRSEMKDDLTRLVEKIEKMEKLHTRVGGIIFGFTALGAAVSYVLTTFAGWFKLPPA